MSDRYMPSTRKRLPALGKSSSKILIIIDHPDTKAFKVGKILDGACLGALQESLNQADLVFSDVCVECLVPDDPNPARWWVAKNSNRPLKDLTATREHLNYILANSKANIILGMGDLAHYLLTDRRKLHQDRGYIFPCTVPGFEGRKVMGLQDIKKMIWGNYLQRYYLASDIQKAYENSESPEIIYDQRETRIVTNVQEANVLISNLIIRATAESKAVSVDIEVSNFQVSHIGFAIEKEKGFSIPFNNQQWTIEEEVEVWRWINAIMGDPKVAKVGQNFIFDIHFLLIQNAIITRGEIIDTMMAQSVYYPDFLKGLGFLASIYINVPQWKDMVSHKDVKIKEDN